MSRRRWFYCALEYEERENARCMANDERDRQLAGLRSTVMQLEAGQERLYAALELLMETRGVPATARTNSVLHAVANLADAARIDDEFIRAFEEEYDRAERRKQALKERIRQMDVERRARYSLSR